MIKEELKEIKEEVKSAYNDMMKYVRDYEGLRRFRNLTIDSIDLGMDNIRNAHIRYMDGEIDKQELNKLVNDQLSYIRGANNNYLNLKEKIKNDETTEETK